VDLQLSGHTHHGQIWPGNLISERFMNSVGIQEEKWYSGLRFVRRWHLGPPVRLGNRPEIVNIRLRFAKLPR